MSTLVQAEVVNGIVLVAVLQADLGARRPVSAWRLVRPIIVAAIVVPLFISPLALSGGGLAIEVAGVLSGLVLGVVALTLVHVHREPGGRHPTTTASWPYAAFWVVVIGARAVFSYGSVHLFRHQLDHWLRTNRIRPDSITDGLILMAVALIVTRTGGLAVRAHSRRLASQPAADLGGLRP